ncbi:phosphatase PAP2 family protein [Paenarthrobacter sp. Z7-10]|uniref:phosphatase PAP2 family protein n=1 Tax=Paenarthrobacter sp. Z7-10 TaxID=2787635 RepID=UPI0022A9107B|nr:phosphatase PAP2 family protein [Paenarthrobacter sp. Z7-10]MCZ2402183.1 phosphatase PAP2 family protein [Paenarthrobacter sp. Z7-10]
MPSDWPTDRTNPLADDQQHHAPSRSPNVPDQSGAQAAERSGVRGELRDDRFVGGRDLTHWKSSFGRFLARIILWIGARLGPHTALVLTLVVGILLAVSLTAVSAQVYESVTEADGVAGLDHPLLETAMSLRSPALDAAVTAYTDVGGTVGMPILAAVALTVLVLTRRSWTPVILIVAAAAGSLSMTIAGKRLIGRARPPLADAVPPYEHSASFPSGHALNAVVIAGIVAYLLILRLHSTRSRVLCAVVAAVFAITIGLSRVFLGHHWFTDVLAAWTLGLAWLALVITAHRLYLTVRKVRRHGSESGTADSPS